MGKRVYKEGIRVNVWIPKEYRERWHELENNSKFVQLCLDEMVGIMTWSILKASDPPKYHRPQDDVNPLEVIPEFNEKFPLDPMTKRRMEKNKKVEEKEWPPTPSPSRHELW